MAAKKPTKLNHFQKALLEGSEWGGLAVERILTIVRGEPCAGVYPSTSDSLKAAIWVAEMADKALSQELSEDYGEELAAEYTREEAELMLKAIDIRDRTLEKIRRESKDA